MTEQEQRQAVVNEARSWVGTDFHFNACLKDVGVACGPFCIIAYKPYYQDIGKVLPVPPTFPRDWHFHTKEERLRNVVAAYCKEVEVPLSGDVVLFRLGAKDRPYSHGGIVIEWPIIIHSWYRTGVVEVNAKENRLLNKCEVSFWSPWRFEQE